MGERTKISWCDHSFNPWIGCTKVGPGCEACYAEAWDARMARMDLEDPATHWGAGVPRRYFPDSHWHHPIVWNRKAEAAGVRRRVFCASMADIFDNEVDQKHRNRVWDLVGQTPMLDWLFVTKRIGNAAKMIHPNWSWPNVWLIATVVNQEEANRDIPKLLELPAAVRGLSVEPMLGPIELGVWLTRIDWVICGGESRQPGHEPRPMEPVWADDLLRQCTVAGVAFHFKQAGEVLARQWGCQDKAGKIPEEWPSWARVQEFPRVPSTGRKVRP